MLSYRFKILVMALLLLGVIGSLVEDKPPTYSQGYNDGVDMGVQMLRKYLKTNEHLSNEEIDSIYTASYRQAKLEMNE
jgi:hypothetical protein